ncbi:unnamed protein product [Rotaria socialis]|uniref:Uncharacterized protein n=2 Tax=Rotaria socialis TaxID=392032 RepID=A0A821TV10_9BILA|nr:unnamed protein product [Rotaria socialis]
MYRKSQHEQRLECMTERLTSAHTPLVPHSDKYDNDQRDYSSRHGQASLLATSLGPHNYLSSSQFDSLLTTPPAQNNYSSSGHGQLDYSRFQRAPLIMK